MKEETEVLTEETAGKTAVETPEKPDEPPEKKQKKQKKPKKKKSRVRRIVGIVLLVWVVYLIICGTVPPAFQPTADPEDLPVLTGGDPAERVMPIDDNQDALVWRLRLIQQAEKSLDLSYFGFVDDASGRDAMSALLAAGERGVHIRLLVDGSNFQLDWSTRFRSLAECPNIEVRVYNPIFSNVFLRPWQVNYRMHDKYIIADGETYILGGRNIRDVSLGYYMEERDQDRDLLVWSPDPGEDSSITDLEEYFDETWNLSCVSRRNGPLFGAEDALEELRHHYEGLRKTCPAAFEARDMEACTMKTNGVVLLGGAPTPDNKKPIVWDSIIKLMSEGQESIIQTPYLTCNGKMYDDLIGLHEAGKEVSVVLNSPQTGANVACSVDYFNQKSNLSKLGADLYECYGDHSIHTKTILIDDRISVVGSFNCDMRSVYLDTELMLVVDCPELNQELRRQVEADMDKSLKILPDGQEIPGPDWNPAELGLGKKIIYGILRVLVWPLRQLL